MPERLAAVSKNVDAINTAVFLIDGTQIRSYFNSWNMYGRFIIYSSKIARPFNDYLQRDK